MGALFGQPAAIRLRILYGGSVKPENAAEILGRPDVDGASPWHKFGHVTLPLLTPTIFFTLVMGVIGSFQVFTQGFVMTGGGPNNATLFYVLYLYQNAFQFLKMGYASALAWVLFALILTFTLIQMRLSGWVHYEGSEAK